MGRDGILTVAIKRVWTTLINLDLPIWAYGLLLYCSSLAITGYNVYFSNQALQLPLVALLNDPSLYPNDPFAATLPYYASMLWRLVALLSRLVPLESLLLGLFIIERALVIYAAGYLAYHLGHGSRLAVVGGMAFFSLAPSPLLGGGTLVTSYLEQTGLSIPFFLLSIAAFHADHPIHWALMLSIGLNLNSMYGMYALTYFAAAFLLDASYRTRWKSWGAATGLLAGLASPAIVLTASAFGRTPASNDLWLAASWARFPHHLYPLTWSKLAFAEYTVLLFLIVALLYQTREKNRKLFTHGIVWTGVNVMWLLYAFVAAYVIPSPSMLVMQPARGTDLWYCFAGTTLISSCAAVPESEENRILSAIALFASIFFWRPPPSLFIIVGLMVLAWRPAWERVLHKGQAHRISLVLVLLILIRGGYSSWQRFRTSGAFFEVPPNPQVKAVAAWAGSATNAEATFLVDPLWEEFRAISKRPVFVTWKDGSAILWDRSFVMDWVSRLSALGLDITQTSPRGRDYQAELGRLYADLDDDKVKTMMARFRLHYWVVPQEHTSAFPVVFQTDMFKVLGLRDGEDSDPG